MGLPPGAGAEVEVGVVFRACWSIFRNSAACSGRFQASYMRTVRSSAWTHRLCRAPEFALIAAWLPTRSGSASSNRP